MKSFDIKYYCLRWLLFEKNCLGAFTESINNSDVFGINPNRFPIEIEVKRDRTDLKNELHEIYNALNGQKSIIKTKGDKHYAYLRGVDNYKQFLLPKYFYFAVPEELEPIARQGILGTPYGLLMLYTRQYPNIGDRIHLIERVKAQKMSEEKISVERMLPLLRKTSFENMGLREKLLAVNMR